jgi:hypothetical protein
MLEITTKILSDGSEHLNLYNKSNTHAFKSLGSAYDIIYIYHGSQNPITLTQLLSWFSYSQCNQILLFFFYSGYRAQHI